MRKPVWFKDFSCVEGLCGSPGGGRFLAHLVVAQWGPGLWQPGKGGAEEGLCLKVPCFKGWRKVTRVSSGAMGLYRVRNLQRFKENYGVL